MEMRYMTVQELADYLRVSKWSIYKLVDRRRIPFITLSTAAHDSCSAKRGIIRFDVLAIDKWMRQRAVKPFAKNSV